MSDPFWKTKSLEDLTPEEWESLCDSCGKCCLHKLQDEDSGEIFYTYVVCRLMDLATCRCTAYLERTVLNPTCLKLDIEKVRTLTWLPDTCAYRLLREGKGLLDWHPLVSGSADTVFKAGLSVLGKCISEQEVNMDALEDFIVEDEDEE